MPMMGVNARGLSMRAHFGDDRHIDALDTLYWAAFVGHPLRGGSEAVEGTGGYGRATTSNSAALWGAISPSDVSISNEAEIVWPVNTGSWNISGSSELIFNHWAIFDAATAGTLWYAGPLAFPLTNNVAGTQQRIAVHGLTLLQAA